MAAFAGKMVAKKVLGSGKKGDKPNAADNPYFEDVEAQKYGVKYHTKKKRTLHPGLTSDEALLLTKVKKRAYQLDLSLFNLFGLRFGWSSVIGIVPMVGDGLDLLMAYSVVRTCQSVTPGLPSDIQRKMYMNLIIDFVIGFVPLLGDLADAAYKCNTKNVMLLEKELNKRADKRERDAGRVPPPVQEGVFEGDGDEIEMAPSREDPPGYASDATSKRQGDRRHDKVHPSTSRSSAERAGYAESGVTAPQRAHGSRSQRHDLR